MNIKNCFKDSWQVIIFLILLFLIVFSLSLGRYPISVKDIFYTLFSEVDTIYHTAIFEIRLPRILSVFFDKNLIRNICVPKL